MKKLKRIISVVLTTVMLMSVMLCAPFKVSAATITLHAWISDSIMGEEAKSCYVGNMYYLCYELIDQNGTRFDKTGNWSYTVKETMYEVDGSVAHTYSYNNDNNYIGIRRNQAGTYKGNVTVKGDINISVDVSYTLSYNAGLSSSLSKVSLNLNGTNSATLRITPTGAYPGKYSLSRSYDDSIASVTFNKWDGDTAVYDVKGLKVGSTNLVLKLKENYTDSKTVVASISIPISVTANIYTISYHPNGGTGAPSSQSAYYGNNLTVSSTIPTRSGYEFVGWGINSSSTTPFCQPGDTISLGSNMTVYAIWNKKQTSISDCTISLSATSYTYDGTEKKPSVTVKDGSTTLINGTDYVVYYSDNTNVGAATVTIAGRGNYSGAVLRTFIINAKPISSTSVTLGTMSYTYDGTEKQPSVTVKYGTTTLTNGTDYTVSYTNNTNAGTATATITGKGNYTGTVSKTFTINAKSISSATVTLSTTSYTHDGTAKKPSVTVKDGSTTLTNGTDYTVSYSNNTNIGTATVTITGKGNYTGTASKNFTITEVPKINISSCTFSLGTTSYTYDGTAKQPSVTVKYGSKTLTSGTDYTVTYSNNTNAGTATATITGKGNYTGTVSKTFTINAKSISSTTVTLGTTSYTYDGTAKKPSVTVKDGSTTLTNGTDYTVSYSNNTNIGTATVTITGKGNYTGTASKNFTITEAPKINISSCTSSLGTTSYTYDGTAKKPSVTVKDGSKTLTNGTDYTVSYSNNTNVGTATVTITGKGNYTGTASKTFTINAKSISSTTVTLGTTSYTYDGTAKKPSVTVKDGSKTLTSGTDYTVSYSNNTNAGTATVTVTGKGNYTGTVSKNFTITNSKKEFTWGQDNWNFNNSYTYFGYGTYRSQINNTYLRELEKNLTNSEYQVIFSGTWYSGAWIDDSWRGSCYGMSSTSLLSKKGLLPYSQYTSGANCLFDLSTPKNDSDINSLITYYQMLQVKSVIQQQYRTVPNKSNKENIGNIISLLKENDTVLVGFKKDGWGGHAILAYDYEYGSYTWNGVTYQGCIKICDPNCSKNYNNKYNIYFNTNTYNWAIPAYSGITSASGAVFNYVGSNIDEINKGGYLSGNTGNLVSDYVARINALSISDNRSVSKVKQTNGEYFNQNTAPGDIVEDYSYILGGESEGTIGYNLYDNDAAYKITQSNPEELQLSIDYDNCYFTAGSKAGKSVIFDKNGYVQVESESSEYNMSMTFDENYDTDWFTIQVTGSNADIASLTKVDGGYVLQANNLENVNIGANNKEDSAFTSFSTDYDSVYIYEINPNTIGLKVDTDNNGTYETELNTTMIGDVNGDGSVTVLDATMLQKYLAGLASFSDEQLEIADTNGDGKITVLDATAIQKYLANLITSLG